MTFEEVAKKYPLHTTFVGNYYHDESFTIKHPDDVKDIDRWDYAPLDWGYGSLPFVYHNPSTNEFECWMFSYFPVMGYINETDNPNNFYPATYSEDFGWEKVDLNNTEDIILVKPEDTDEEDAYLSRVIQAAKRFDAEAFEEGRILLTYDGIKVYAINHFNA